MKQLWAPWRLQFISDKKNEKTTACVFCELLKQEPSVDNLVLTQTENWSVFINRFPYNNGHLLLIPKAHVKQVNDLPQPTQDSFGIALACLEHALQECYKPDGINVGYNLGKSAGAGIPDHVHAHMVPRWSGDTNFMPVIGETKCIPDHLNSMYTKLQPFIKKYFKETL
jgi:ATP adenylyltransferase